MVNKNIKLFIFKCQQTQYIQIVSMKPCCLIKMLKSEVEQLDEAFGKIFYDEPQQSVIDNLKKKHGLLVNDNKNYERFDELGMHGHGS